MSAVEPALRSPAPELNRTEAVKSVLLSLLLRSPGVAGQFISTVLAPECCMRDKDGCPRGLCVTGPDEAVSVKPLFHAWRDFKYSGLEARFSVKNEIDIVVHWPKQIVLGLELKWQSSVSGLSHQLRQEQKVLRALAEHYGAPNTSLVAILPRPRTRPAGADGVVATARVADFAESVARSRSDQHLLGVIAGELRQMVPENIDRKTYSFRELVDFVQPAADANYFVGYYNEMADLRERPLSYLQHRLWKINPRQSGNHRWLPLADVQRLFRSKLTAAASAAS